MSSTMIQGYIAIVLSSLCVWYTAAVTLLPYGPGAGDTEWTSGLSDDSELFVPFQQQTFPFDQSERSNITINSNGNLNFEGSSSLSGWKNQDVIAPFWDDLHPGNKQPGQGHIYYRETTDPDILSNVHLFVREIHGIRWFCPTWAFVVTWNDVAHYPPTTKPYALNFQVVLAKEESISFVVMFYEYLYADSGSAEVGVSSFDGQLIVDGICRNGQEYDLVRRKQSKCQSSPGILSFRTDIIEDPGMCRDTIIDEGCTSNDDCSPGNGTRCPLCNTALGACVECLSDDDCHDITGSACETSTGLCKCFSNDDCPDPTRPVCVACTASCGCDSHEDCVSPGLLFCVGTVDKTCKECGIHSHCTQDPYRVCNEEYRCKECLEDRDCRDDNRPACEAQTCVCLNDTNCSNNRVCDPTTSQCVCRSDSRPCTEAGMACNSTGHCGCLDGYVPIDVGCTRDCDPPCLKSQTCSVTRQCLQGCMDPDDCPSGTKLATLGSCVKSGLLGGDCVFGSCFDKNAVCDRRSNRCVCRERCEKKLVCIKRH